MIQEGYLSNALSRINGADINTSIHTVFLFDLWNNHRCNKVVAKAISRLLPADVEIELIEDFFPKDKVVGDATGVNVRLESSTGCIFGSSSLGSAKKKADIMGNEAINEVIDHSIQHGACLDEWMQDQLIIFMVNAQFIIYLHKFH